jgi:hypothetical protein
MKLLALISNFPIGCSCGRVCIGQTGRHISTENLEHIRCTRLQNSQAAVVEHFTEIGRHHLQWNWRPDRHSHLTHTSKGKTSKWSNSSTTSTAKTELHLFSSNPSAEPCAPFPVYSTVLPAPVHSLTVRFILSWFRGDYRQGLDWWLNLLTTYSRDTELQAGTALSLVYTLYKTLQHTLSLSLL